MDIFENLILELKGKLKKAKSGDKPSIYTEKVKYVYNLVKGYRKSLESIEKKMEEYLREKKKIDDQKGEDMLFRTYIF